MKSRAPRVAPPSPEGCLKRAKESQRSPTPGRHAISLGWRPDGSRIRRKVTGRTKTEVRQKLKKLQAWLAAVECQWRGLAADVAVTVVVSSAIFWP